MPRPYNMTPHVYAEPLEDVFGAIQHQLPIYEQALSALNHSLSRCRNIPCSDSYTFVELEKLEALKNRFIRAADLFLVVILPLADKIDDEKPGTIVDTMKRAEKKRIISNYDTLIEIRNLREELSCTCISVKVDDLRNSIVEYSPHLFDYQQGFLRYAKYRNFYLEPEKLSFSA